VECKGLNVSWDLLIKIREIFHLSEYLRLIQIIVGYSKSGIGEIEKVGDIKSQNLNIGNHSQHLNIEKYYIGSFKISLFRMKKFQNNKLILYKTFFQWFAFEMSHFDILNAKNII